MKTCSKCHVEKPLSEFRNDSKTRDGKYRHCKECHSNRNKEYYATPRGMSSRALGKSRYVKRQIEQELGIEIHDDLQPHQIAVLHGQAECTYCRRELVPSEVTVDHVIPFARLGPNTFSNVVAACGSCNSSKADKPALLYMIQNCSPQANGRLLERLALRTGSDVSEVYAGLVADAQMYFASQTALTSDA